MMSLDAYVDGVIELLVGAGVPREEADTDEVRDTLVMCHMKGRDWTTVATSMCRKFGIEVTE